VIGNRLNIKKRKLKKIGWNIYEICYSDYADAAEWCKENATGCWDVSKVKTTISYSYVAFQNEGDALIYKLTHPI